MLLIAITKERVMFKVVVILLELQHLLKHHLVSTLYSVYLQKHIFLLDFTLTDFCLFCFLQLQHLDVFTLQVQGMFLILFCNFILMLFCLFVN